MIIYRKVGPALLPLKNRAAISLRDLTKRKGFDNAYDVMDRVEAKIMEEEVDAVKFHFPDYASPGQSLVKGKMVEII